MWRIISKSCFVLIIITLAVLFSSSGCSPLYETEGVRDYDIIDFTKYSKEGFMFTPEEYRGDYESCGLIRAEIVPAIRKQKNIPPDKQNDYRSIYDDLPTEYFVEKISVKDVLDKIVKLATEKGADCIMRLDIKVTDKSITTGTRRYGIVATGFAIKRKLPKE